MPLKDYPADWIDPLSEPAVALAAYVWKTDEATAWSRLSAAIKNEELSDPLPFTEFQGYIRLFIPDSSPSQTILPPAKKQIEIDEDWIKSLKDRIKPNSIQSVDIEPYRLSPPSLAQRIKGVLRNVVWQPFLIFLCVVAFIIGQTSTSTQPIPTATPNISLTNTAWNMEVHATLTARACLEDTMNNVPFEYSRCNDNPLTEEPEDIPYYFDGESIDSATCLIKGNISFETGERIYHLPGQEFYDVTIIDTSEGERWFCTEAEAQAAGWRKARQ